VGVAGRINAGQHRRTLHHLHGDKGVAEARCERVVVAADRLDVVVPSAQPRGSGYPEGSPGERVRDVATAPRRRTAPQRWRSRQDLILPWRPNQPDCHEISG
jgi:hypothetical protein